jgi:phosphoserine phosphatase
MVEADPALRERQPYKALVEGDHEWLGALGEHLPELLQGISEAFSGITTDAFVEQVVRFFETATHPTLSVSYETTAYLPMVELLGYLRENEFRVFLCTGGGRDFVRVVSESMYGVARDQVIGSSAPVEYRDGSLFRTPGVEQPVDDGPGKPAHIWARTGRRPLFAAGNADGDIQMLSEARFSLLVHHDDAEREFAYDLGAEGVLAEAKAHDWTVASMARDFARVF